MLRHNPGEGEVAAAPEIALGIASIDIQHQDLLDFLNAFDAGIRASAPLDEMQGIVERALACANAHFDHEEDLMARTNFPQMKDHKFLHRHMRMEFETLANNVMDMQLRDAVTLEQLGQMRAMLMEHITGPDRDLATFLKSAGIA